MQMKNENGFGCGARRTQTKQKAESAALKDKKGIGHDVPSTATDSENDFEQEKYITSPERCQSSNHSEVERKEADYGI